MALTYTWEVTGLKVRDQVNSDGVTLADSVCQTFWKVEGTDESGHTATHIGATPFTAENVPEGTFVPFASLTEETVLGWIRNYVENDEVYFKHIEEMILKDIDRQHNIREPAMPWAPAEEVTPTLPEDAPADDSVANTAGAPE